MIPCRRQWQPTPVFLPGEFHGQRSLAAFSPWGHTRLSDWAQAQAWIILLPDWLSVHPCPEFCIVVVGEKENPLVLFTGKIDCCPCQVRDPIVWSNELADWRALRIVVCLPAPHGFPQRPSWFHKLVFTKKMLMPKGPLKRLNKAFELQMTWLDVVLCTEI